MIQSCFRMYCHASLIYSMRPNDYHIHILGIANINHAIVAVPEKRICAAFRLRSQECSKAMHLKVDPLQSLHQSFMTYSNEYVEWKVDSCLSSSFSHQHPLSLQDLTLSSTSFFSEREKKLKLKINHRNSI